MYVQYSGQLPYYAQPAQYQQPAYAGVSAGVQQPVVQMPQQYPATYSGYAGGAYVGQPQASPSPYGQFAQYGQLQVQPQYAQLQYQPQLQPSVQPHAIPQTVMPEGGFGQASFALFCHVLSALKPKESPRLGLKVMQPIGQPAYIPAGYAKPGELQPASVQMPGAQRVGTNLTQVTGPEGEEDDDPNRLPTFVKVRGLPAEHDPRIARRPRPKKRAPGICCA
ncbi:unnamed protein product [Durusdinium trenchii]|uniref:Uncharacterized protein n=1 Tax=Durusdinium trenchii TaxID=1381693 RepID=A0ABP0N7I9_9DINO